MANVYTRRSFYTQQAFAGKSFYTEAFLYRMTIGIGAPKPRRQSEKNTILKHFLKGLLEGKLLAPKLRKSADKSLSQPWCSHSKTIYVIQLNIHAAITMRFAASRGLPACIYAHGNRAWQQSCSHSNAICNQSFKKCIKLRKQEQTPVAEHRGGTNSRMTIRCRTQRRNQFAHETTPAAPAARTRYLSSPAAATLHGKTQGFVSCSRFLPKTKPMQHSCSHYNAFCSITWLTRMYLRTWQQSMTIIMQPFQCDLQPELQETNYAHRNNHSLQNTEEEPIRAWNDPSRTRRTHEVPFIAGCSHFARKNPKQSPCNIHAAITMRFAASRGLPACIYAHGNRAWQQSCSHSNAICNQSFKKRTTQTGTNSRCKTQRRNQFAHDHSLQNTEEEPIRAWNDPRGGTNSRMKRPQPHPPHGEGTFHRRLQPLCTEKRKVSFRAPASSPKQSPCNIHVAITMRFAASRGLPASIYAHGNRAWQQSCSHSNAICNQSFKKRIKLRKQEQPLVAEHRGGTNSRMKRPQPHPPHTRGTFHRRLQPLCTEKRKVSCSGSLPKTKPMQHSCSHYNAFCSITWLTRMYLRTWQQSMTTIMQPLHECIVMCNKSHTTVSHHPS